MSRMFLWFIGFILFLSFAPAVLTEVGRLLVPLLAKGIAVGLIAAAIWCALRIVQARRFGAGRRTGGTTRGNDPWRF